VESYPYQVTTAAVTLNEFDNANGGEVVLYGNSLTNALDSTNWTAVYASTSDILLSNGVPQPYAGSATLPTIYTNYDNSRQNSGLSMPGDFVAWFGKSVHDPANDASFFGSIDVPQSATMAANGWSNALKVTVNKGGNVAEAGLNLYPQGQVFYGNYALRFDMYLSLYDFAVNNSSPNNSQRAIAAREFAAFGMNHYGTNANWRLDSNPRVGGTGAFPINADGEWCTIGASSGSITPADYDMFISPNWVTPIYSNGVNTNAEIVPYTVARVVGVPFTNAYQSGIGNYVGITNVFADGGVPNDQVSQNNNGFGGTPENGVIKNPPFIGVNTHGGAPDNAWVDVSLEMTRSTNLTLKVAQQVIMSSSITNPAAGVVNMRSSDHGTPMLGYLDPSLAQDVQSDGTAFAYYSNLRLVEISPFTPMTNQPISSIICTQGSSFALTSGATYAQGSLTNVWYRGTTNGATAFPKGITNNTLANALVPNFGDMGTPTLALVTNVFTNSFILDGVTYTTGNTNFTVSNIQNGTNFMSVWKDASGSVTNWMTVVEVIVGPGTVSANGGTTANLAVTASGDYPPSPTANVGFHWQRFGTNLASTTKYGSTTNVASLFITNVTAADAGLYSVVVQNGQGLVGGRGITNCTAVGQLNVTVAPSGAVVTPAVTNAPWGSAVTLNVSASGTAPLTYTWKKGGNNVVGDANTSGLGTSALTITNLSQSAYGGNYNVGVTNAAGGTLSSAGTLNVVLLPHSVTGITVTSSNVVMTFTSANSSDNTSGFTLQSAGDVTGPYTNTASSVFQTTGPGAFQVTAPNNGDQQLFYRLVHSN